MKDRRRIAYIMSRFPGLSETFILREMCEMELLGWNLDLYPLIYQEESIIHDEAKDWMKRAWQPSLFDIATANVKLMLTRPLLYFSIIFQVLWGNLASPKFLSRAIVLFPKAVWMARQMLLNKITHIHSHYATHPALAAWIINRISGIPYSITVHAHDIFVDRSMLVRKLLDAKCVFAISEFNRKFLCDLFGSWVTEKTHIIHCGIYQTMYSPRSVRANENRKLELLSIGSLRSYKGFAFLLDACYFLKRDGVKFRCRIIGAGELHDTLSAKIKTLDIGDSVELVGPKKQKDVAELLGMVDCYVQPSIVTSTGKMEGIPVSLMEAMASCLPVIATNISGIPELVKHGVTGWLVPPEDSKALADAILRVYNNPEDAARCAQSGRELVLREFDVAGNVTKLSEILDSSVEDM